MASNWQAAAERVTWNVGAFIDGRYQESSSSDTYDKVNPATETVTYRASIGSAVEVDEAVDVSRKRFEDGCWSQLPASRRAEVILKLAELLVQNKSEFALLDSLDMGKPISAALQDAEVSAPLFLRAAAGYADKLCGLSAPTIGNSLYFNLFEPRGVVGLITPWNFPIVNLAIKLGPALAAGNTVVAKPSELSAGSALRLAELALQAGLPEGVFNVVPGLGSTVGAALASHAGVDLLSFTGSTATGRVVMESAARSIPKPVLLECGGKCPQVVFDDAGDLERVAQAVVQSFLWNQGQVCTAHTRLIVQENIRDSLVEAVVARAALYKPGNPLDPGTTFGPLASPGQRDRVRKYVFDGLAAGARAVLKGDIRDQGGCYVSPTIFDQVESRMPIWREEIFGPVLCVQSFKTEEEAVVLANDTPYGLVATVWTRDLGRGTRLARKIRAGHISVRTGAEESPGSGAMLSHEPQKASGFGAETGIGGLQSYATLKSISLAGR